MVLVDNGGQARPTSNAAMMERGPTKSSVIERGSVRIVITDSPSDASMEDFLRHLISLKVRAVVRACEPSYDTTALERAGVVVHDMQFPDGNFYRLRLVRDAPA